MKVAHIVPAAFDYFNDIKKNAFETVERLNDYGVESHIITLQYEQPEAKEKAILTGQPSQDISGVAPSYSFKGIRPIDQTIDSLNQYDLVHLHCPFLGAAAKIYRWKKQNPQIPLVATYYRQVELVDLLSFFIRLYNTYYLTKIFKLAEIIAVFPQTWKKHRFYWLANNKIINITPEPGDPAYDALEMGLTNYANQVKLNKIIIAKMSFSKLMTTYLLLTDYK